MVNIPICNDLEKIRSIAQEVKLTVVFDYYEAKGNLQSYLSTTGLWKLTVVFIKIKVEPFRPKEVAIKTSDEDQTKEVSYTRNE